MFSRTSKLSYLPKLVSTPSDDTSPMLACRMQGELLFVPREGSSGCVLHCSSAHKEHNGREKRCRDLKLKIRPGRLDQIHVIRCNCVYIAPTPFSPSQDLMLI